MVKLTPDQVRKAAAGIATARLALGVVALVAPRMSARLAGINTDDSAARAFFGFFAVREVVLGLTVLDRVRAGYPSSTLLRINALCDAGDFAVLASAARRPDGIGRLALSIPVAGSVAAAWTVLAHNLDEA